MGSWSLHTTTNGYTTYRMSEFCMCTPTDPRFHKKRKDFRYVYTYLTVLYTNSLKKGRPAPPPAVDVSSPARDVARPRRDVDVPGHRARVPARLSSLVSRASRARSRENPARAPAATIRAHHRATPTTPTRARAPPRDRGPPRTILDTPVSPDLDRRARRKRRRRARWTRGRFGGRRRGTRVDARASTNAREREIRTSIGAWTMI